MYRDHIRTIYEHLSPGYRRIADFLLTHYQDAAFMTAAEVARQASVDTALVVRFAQRLGYPGYPELNRRYPGRCQAGSQDRLRTPGRGRFAGAYPAPQSDARS